MSSFEMQESVIQLLSDNPFTVTTFLCFFPLNNVGLKSLYFITFLAIWLIVSFAFLVWNPAVNVGWSLLPKSVLTLCMMFNTLEEQNMSWTSEFRSCLTKHLYLKGWNRSPLTTNHKIAKDVLYPYSLSASGFQYTLWTGYDCSSASRPVCCNLHDMAKSRQEFVEFFSMHQTKQGRNSKELVHYVSNQLGVFKGINV